MAVWLVSQVQHPLRVAFCSAWNGVSKRLYHACNDRSLPAFHINLQPFRTITSKKPQHNKTAESDRSLRGKARQYICPTPKRIGLEVHQDWAGISVLDAAASRCWRVMGSWRARYWNKTCAHIADQQQPGVHVLCTLGCMQLHRQLHRQT